jgi:hypothetical protein
MKILVGAPVNQTTEIFERYLTSLRNLNGKFDLFFILHNSPHLKELLNDNEYIEFNTSTKYEPHNWTPKNLKEVGIMRNMLLDYVKANNYDYFFSVDSDQLVHPNTLQHLLSFDKDIVGEIMWTKWKIDDKEMPNAWLSDYYEFGNFPIDLFRVPGLYKVGMLCGCYLIKKEVWLAGVNYNPIYNISFTAWEDRAFFVRAAVHGFDCYLDTSYPIEHLYYTVDA